MLNVSQVLTRLNINADSRCAAVQDVRHLIESSENPIGAAKAIIHNLINTDFVCNDPIVARMTAQRLVDEAIILGDRYDPEQALLKAAEKIAQARIDSPWSFYRESFSTVETKTEQREGVSVEVKTDGSFKKGSKQILAKALYEKHKALSNAEIITIFMKELDMSKPGATTYLYNAKKGATTAGG
jgi:hypothetical protein